jgi:signal transduction histidine kinase/CheY-like chemotaxis protein
VYQPNADKIFKYIMNNKPNIHSVNEHKGYALLGEQLEIKLHTSLIGDLLKITALPHNIKVQNPYFFSFIDKLVKQAKINIHGWSQAQLLLGNQNFCCTVNTEKEAEHGQQKNHLFVSYVLDPKLQKSFLELIQNDANIGRAQLALEDEKLALERVASVHKSKLAAIGEISASIGHEINNPLAIALGNLEFLKTALNDDALLSQKTHHYLYALDTSLERIQSIVSGLRYLARDESHEARSEVNIHDLLEITVLLMREIYAKQGITLQYALNQQQNIFVVGHFGELQQVLMNLISNARDAVIQSPNKDILVSTELTSDEINIKITDSGIGISTSEQKLIFNNFFSSKKTALGTGLGLGIVKRILEDHQGGIAVESKINEGSSFLVTLPIAHSSERSVSKKLDIKPNVEGLSVSTHLSNVNVIIIDDEPMLLEIVSANLTSLGMSVFATDNFNRVLEEVKTAKYQLLITDMSMPECDGLKLIQQVKKLSTGKVKCILMTGGLVNGINPRGLSSNHLDGVLVKPFHRNDLLKLLNKLNLQPENNDVG